MIEKSRKEIAIENRKKTQEELKIDYYFSKILSKP
jgi:hypothetical protein